LAGVKGEMAMLKVNFFPFLSHVRDRLVTGFIVVCILLNGFVPKFSIDTSGREVFSQIMASQSILLHFFVLSTIPKNIVGEIFKERNLPPAQQKQQPAKQRQNSSNSSADYSALNADTRNAQSRNNCFQRGADTDGKFFISWPGVSRTLSVSENYLPGVNSVFVVLLIFFFLRPRSSLPDGAIAIISQRIPETRLAGSSRVFLLPGICLANPIGSQL